MTLLWMILILKKVEKKLLLKKPLKDPTKADVTLNILARLKALEYLHTHEIDEVHCAISCCIGRPEIRISWFDAQNRLLETCVSDEPPSHVIESLGLRYPGYAERCREGLFGHE